MAEYIKREDVLNLFEYGYCECFPNGCGKCGHKKDCTVGNIIDLPTADVVPVRHGKWIDKKCSICGEANPIMPIAGKVLVDLLSDYCPMCGAKMDLEVQDG